MGMQLLNTLRSLQPTKMKQNKLLEVACTCMWLLVVFVVCEHTLSGYYIATYTRRQRETAADGEEEEERQRLELSTWLTDALISALLV